MGKENQQKSKDAENIETRTVKLSAGGLAVANSTTSAADRDIPSTPMGASDREPGECGAVCSLLIKIRTGSRYRVSDPRIRTPFLNFRKTCDLDPFEANKRMHQQERADKLCLHRLKCIVCT